MAGDDFSQKEILLRVMSQTDSIQKSLIKQELLLQQHIDASINRDELMREIKLDVEKLELRVGSLEILKFKIAGMWLVVSFVGYFAIDFLYRKLLG